MPWNLINFGLGNGLLPTPHRAITGPIAWDNTDLLSFKPFLEKKIQ